MYLPRILSAAALLLVACGPPSVEAVCDDLAVAQCERCYACDGDGGELCQLGAGVDEDQCVVEMSDRCANQASTLDRPKEDLATCSDSLETLACDTLEQGAAQNLAHTTDACSYCL